MGKIKIGKLLVEHGKTNMKLLHQRNEKLINHLQELFVIRKPVKYKLDLPLTNEQEDFIIESGMEELSEQRELEKMDQYMCDENEF